MHMPRPCQSEFDSFASLFTATEEKESCREKENYNRICQEESQESRWYRNRCWEEGEEERQRKGERKRKRKERREERASSCRSLQF